ncbi:MAG: tRNA-dihydrouridine synthase [Candidatus Hydrothermarchaeota archaeon]
MESEILFQRIYNKAGLSAMSGYTDIDFCKKVAEEGAAWITLGGFNIDERSQEAGVLVSKRRKHFTLTDIYSYLDEGIKILKKFEIPIFINVRGIDGEKLEKLSRFLIERGAYLELNAHCRQPEYKKLGLGQELLKKPQLLKGILDRIKKRTGMPAILKARANVVPSKDLCNISKLCDILHLDAMLPGENKADLNIISEIKSTNPDTFLIGNNSITDLKKAIEMRKAGADAVSIARAALKNPSLVGEISKGLSEGI